MKKALLLALFVATDALARPGGGDTYSGDSSGDSGGGDGGVPFALVRLLVWLLFEHPIIGVPVTIAVIAWYWHTTQQKKRSRGWDAGEPRRPPVRPLSARRTLERLKTIDPNFSTVLFEDFVYALYARAHEARGARKLDEWSPYLSDAARAWLLGLARGVARVDAIVVGALHIRSVSGVTASDADTVVNLEIEANYTEDGRDWYATEHWTLARKTTARSKSPETITKFGCPSCGASTAELRDSVCAFCGSRVDTGSFDWRVTGISGRREPRGPRLTGTVHEQGTSLPTVVAADTGERMAKLLARDPALSLEGIQARIRLVHGALNEAWSERAWKKARPFVTDALFQTQLYWIETYKKAGLTNRVDDARVLRIEVAAIDSDAYYDAITARVYATGKDHTVRDADGAVVAGSKTAERPYSEYWTLIRGRSVTRAPLGAAQCPSCGAGLDVGMSGECKYCNAKITSGEFDWVLSRIEQDESYTG